MNAFRKAFKHKLKTAGIARHWHDTAYPGERYDAGQKEYFQDMAERHHEGDWKHVELPVADIEGHHEGHDASEDYIKEYAEKRRSGSEYPPIIVGPHPELPGKWRTIDGQHRLNAARVTGDKTIRAYIPIKKGEQGDWKAEGYKISHKVWNAGGGQHVVRVTATDPQGKPAGGLTFNHYPGTKGAKFMQADSVAVHPDHRRKGIASAMYQYGEKLTGLRFQPARSTSTAGERDDRTDEGKALWNQKNRPFGKSESYFAKLKKNSQLHDKSHVIASAKRANNDIDSPGTIFSQLYGKVQDQKFELKTIPLADIYSQRNYKDGPKFEYPHTPLYIEGNQEDEGWAQKFAKEWPDSSTAEPIIAHPDGNGKHTIVDGRHRVRSAHLRGETHIKAFVPINSMVKAELMKSPYGPQGAGLYSPNDNARRKMGRTAEVAPIGPNKAVQGTKPSAKLQAAAIAAEARAKSKKNPVKVYSRAEINKLMRSGFKMPRGPKIT